MQMIIEGQSHFRPFGLSCWGFADLNKGVGSMMIVERARQAWAALLRENGKPGAEHHSVTEATHQVTH